MNVKLISVTPDAEQTMAYVARVSNPNNQRIQIIQNYLDIVSSIIIGLYLNRNL